MDDADRPRDDLLAELAALRRRVAALERERDATATLLHGDPGGRTPPLVEQMPATVWISDRELRLTWVAGGGARSVSPDPRTLVGQDLYSFLGTHDPATPVIAAHEKALTGESSGFEVGIGDTVFTGHAAPLYDLRGEIRGVIGISIDVTDRVRAERDLRQAAEQVQALSGLIPICMHCKSVRNDAGYWEQVETYVREHSRAEITHGICPDCMKRALDAENPEA